MTTEGRACETATAENRNAIDAFMDDDRVSCRDCIHGAGWTCPDDGVPQPFDVLHRCDHFARCDTPHTRPAGADEVNLGVAAWLAARRERRTFWQQAPPPALGTATERREVGLQGATGDVVDATPTISSSSTTTTHPAPQERTP